MNTSGRLLHRESGQAAVETALVAPMMVFIILGTIQLGMLHQGRLMAEYAAYRVARSGIVNHGDCETMKYAAYTAVLPTLGPPNSGGSSRMDTLALAAVLYNKYTLTSANQFYEPGHLEIIRIEVLNPAKSQIDGLFSTYGSHMAGQEIDYDDVRDDTVIAANLLSVRVTYFYSMRIPFANWMMHSFFMGRESLGQLRGVQFDVQKVGGQSATKFLEDQGAAKGGDYLKLRTLADAQKYVIPLVSTYSMRMQSNLFNNGSRGPKSCAIDP